MKNTTIAFTCSLAGTLALLAVNAGHGTPFGGKQQSVEAMVKYEFGHNRMARAPVAGLPRVQVAKATSPESAGSAQRVAIAWLHDRR